MNIKILWKNDDTQVLFDRVLLRLEELWLSDFIDVEKMDSFDELKEEFSITKEPALVIEESSIEFKDVIFEWIVPELEELKSMFISIVWWSSEWSSCSSGSCWTCSSSCWCGF